MHIVLRRPHPELRTDLAYEARVTGAGDYVVCGWVIPFADGVVVPDTTVAQEFLWARRRMAQKETL